MGSGRWIGMLLVAFTAACGGHSVRENQGGAAGSTSTVHPTPGDPDPQPGDNPTPVDDPEPTDPGPTDPIPSDPMTEPIPPLPVPCEYESLDVVCANADCPASPDAFGDQCAKGIGVSRAATVCGGSVVVIGFSFGQTSWYFDAKGTLTGIISAGDIEELCPDGHGSNARVYGDACQRSGPLVDACPKAACGAPHMCLSGPGCPLHSADVLSTYCSDPTVEVVRAWETTCGGSMLTVTYGDANEVRYCYDEQDMLSGIATYLLTDFSWSVVGTDCRATNQSSLPCVPK